MASQRADHQASNFPDEPTKGSATGAPGALASTGAGTPRWAMRLAFWGAFFGILLLGGFLRFWRLGEQSFWCDETATLGRVSGSYAHLLHSLQGQGFPCGWFSLLWCWIYFLKHAVHLAPGYIFTTSTLRMPAAALGTLNVAAGYLLARQFTTRRVALFIMLLVAINPFLIYYSRDLKMYGAFYFLVTLNAAFFLLWLRGRPWLWFPLYVIASAAMIMTDFIGWMFLFVELSWMLLRFRRRGTDMPLFIGSLGLDGALTYWWWRFHTWFYYGVAFHHTHGSLQWVARYSHIDLRTIMGQPAVSILGFLWPTYPPSRHILNWYRLGPGFLHHLTTRGFPAIEQFELGAAVTMVAVLIMGLVPWHRLRRKKTPPMPPQAKTAAVGRWWFIALWLLIPGVIFGFGSLPKSNPLSLYPHFVIWLPRYMGLMAMAWIIWLGCAIMRLPGVFVRTITAVFLGAVMLASSLTNNLICRQEPWAFINRSVMHYYNPKDHLGMFVAYSLTNHIMDDPAVSMMQTLHNSLNNISGWNFPNNMYMKIPRFAVLSDNPQPWQSIARWAFYNKGLKTLVFADRQGDIRTGPLSTPAIDKLLGPDYHLVYRRTFMWYYQWHYYFASPWRVRVWQRTSTPGHH